MNWHADGKGRKFLRAAMPSITDKALELSLGALISAMRDTKIDTAPRVSAFIGQLAHESACLRFMTELWGPTPQQIRYEPPSPLATRLGNTQPGDGYRYRGRGPIQITGRANYQKYGLMLGLPLEDHPERAAWYGIGCRIAAAFWLDHKLNEAADSSNLESVKRITRIINGGQNGLASRIRYTNLARVALGLEEVA
jgi:putative chitinase